MKRKRKVKEKKKEEENFDFMKTNKDNINNVLRDPNILPIINDLVNRTNKIVIHAYQFVKLYCSFLYENKLNFPVIDKGFIMHVFKVVTIRIDKRGGYKKDNMPPQLQELTKFYEEYYSTTIANNEKITYDKLSYILAYEAIDMVTNIDNNIKEHFTEHLNKYVNIIFGIKEQSAKITSENRDKTIRKELHKQLYAEIGKVKKDLMHFGDLESDEKYHTWILEERAKLFPEKESFDNNIYYDLEKNPQNFLKSMFHISLEFEKLNEIRIEKGEKQIRLFNALPLRTNIIGKNILIDTCGLISNFLGEESTTKHYKNYKENDNQMSLWNRFFKLNRRVFKKGKKDILLTIRFELMVFLLV